MKNLFFENVLTFLIVKNALFSYNHKFHWKLGLSPKIVCFDNTSLKKYLKLKVLTDVNINHSK